MGFQSLFAALTLGMFGPRERPRGRAPVHVRRPESRSLPDEQHLMRTVRQMGGNGVTAAPSCAFVVGSVYGANTTPARGWRKAARGWRKAARGWRKAARLRRHVRMMNARKNSRRARATR